MKFSVVTDVVLQNADDQQFVDLAKELRDKLAPPIAKTYGTIPLNVGVAFRLLPASYERRSFARYTKANQTLTIDVAFTLEELRGLYRAEKKHLMGQRFYGLLESGIAKRAEVDGVAFLGDVKKWCRGFAWLTDEVDYHEDA